MKKIFLAIITALFAVVLLFPREAVSQRGIGSLYSELSKMEVVKAYVGDITDSTPGKMVDVKVLKTMLETALKTRKTIRFEVVKNESEADIAVTVDVTESIWTDEDPVDIITGVGPILMDALMRENYARMQAVFTVKNVKTGKVIWKDGIHADITAKEMSMVDSVLMIKERLIVVFLRDCFGKGHER